MSGEKVRLNILAKGDAARLLRWATLYGVTSAPEGEAYEIRQLLRRMKDMIAPVDLVMLAGVMSQGTSKHSAWHDLAQELNALGLNEEGK